MGLGIQEAGLGGFFGCEGDVARDILDLEFGGGAGVHVDADGSAILGAEEFEAQPAEDVIYDGFGDADVGVCGETGGFKADVGEFVDQDF